MCVCVEGLGVVGPKVTDLFLGRCSCYIAEGRPSLAPPLHICASFPTNLPQISIHQSHLTLELL